MQPGTAGGRLQRMDSLAQQTHDHTCQYIAAATHRHTGIAGMIVSLLGQGIEPLQATACGAWLHGAAGDICAKELGQYAMLPSDMLEALPRLLK